MIRRDGGAATLTLWLIVRLTRVFQVRLLSALLTCAALAFSQQSELRTAASVLARYQRALGGVDTIRKVQSETIRGEVEAAGMQGKATFIYYAKPFKSLLKVTRPDGVEITRGFDGAVSWAITPRGASVDKDTPSRPFAGMPTFNMRSTNRTISKASVCRRHQF